MRWYSITLIATSLASVLVAAPAQAQVARTFVSTTGSDSNNCANVATPCRHFQNAVNATVLGGDVVALDPGNYGSITVTRGITIDGQGWAYVSPPGGGGNAITINANSADIVTIHGVVLDGAGVTAGTNGIVFNSGGSLTDTDCVARNFVLNGVPPLGNGILLQPTSGTLNFLIANTTVSNNSWGIHYIPPSGSPNANGVIDHVIAIDASTGGSGIAINDSSSGGGTVSVAISNSVTSRNGIGIAVGNSFSPLQIQVSIDSVTAAGNITGIAVSGTPTMLLGRSVITGNGTGISNDTSPNTLYTYKDNRIDKNFTADIGGTTPTLNTTLNVQ
jgi:hypothetical protein